MNINRTKIWQWIGQAFRIEGEKVTYIYRGQGAAVCSIDCTRADAARCIRIIRAKLAAVAIA